MKNFANIKDVEPTFGAGHYSYKLLTDEKTSETGVSRYTCREYQEPGVHNFIEGFYVLKGRGFLKYGSEEHVLESGMSFVVLQGMEHSIKCAKGFEEIEVFWFHIPV